MAKGEKVPTSPEAGTVFKRGAVRARAAEMRGRHDREGTPMRMLSLAFTPRFVCYTLSILFTATLLLIILAVPQATYVAAVPLALFGGLSVLGTRDLLQTRHAVLRNYPISAHLRFLLETMRPEMRQYFFEGEKDGAPFSRDKRAVVYQRAKMVLDKRPFGTQYDVYGDGFEWVQHSMHPRPQAVEPFRLTIGGPDRAKPYDASVSKPALRSIFRVNHKKWYVDVGRGPAQETTFLVLVTHSHSRGASLW
jgi:hypothetical protein